MVGALSACHSNGVIHRIIFDELCLGKISDVSRARYRQIARSLVDRGADSIIFGCTEVTLLISEEDVMVPAFDTTRIHVDATLDGVYKPQLMSAAE